ncbi:MAG: hypothetical protein AAGH53_01575 [Pseudomonadota bacterium]
MIQNSGTISIDNHQSHIRFVLIRQKHVKAGLFQPVMQVLDSFSITFMLLIMQDRNRSQRFTPAIVPRSTDVANVSIALALTAYNLSQS